MGLEQYDAKRDFGKTPEPSGGTPGEGRPIFVVHKHDASRLHYDFRLQVGDVLASWAVPKGPSLDPAQKRLAVHVEDHPLDYAGFEGVIPQGEYGGGTVMVWDRGTYEPRNGDPAEAIGGGEIKVDLHGDKLTGGFVLVHMKGRDGKDGRENWLLIKERDEHAREDGDVLAEKPDSAMSGRSMAEIEAAGEGTGDESAEEDEVAGVRLTHPDRVLFAEQGITKRQLAEYYEQVAEHVLPHLSGRPLVLVRCPQGADGSCFYQKDVTQGFPKSVGRLEVQHEEGVVRYALVDDLEGLLALVQLGVLEIHTWGALAADVERPDRLTFDLDPGPDVAWRAVVDAALDVRARLEALGLGAFPKTTGGKGLHVVTPIVPERGWEAARDLARAVVEAIAAEKPERYTTNPRKERRGGKVFLDYIRNTRGATAVAAYSTRAKPGATVSVPVRWDEIEAGVRSDGYTVRNTPYRLRALGGDPWAGYEDARVALTDALMRDAGSGS
ncbi:MAG: non-homologous end-joining DNA ligase [Coriobacteriia bacterium]